MIKPTGSQSCNTHECAVTKCNAGSLSSRYNSSDDDSRCHTYQDLVALDCPEGWEYYRNPDLPSNYPYHQCKKGNLIRTAPMGCKCYVRGCGHYYYYTGGSGYTCLTNVVVVWDGPGAGCVGDQGIDVADGWSYTKTVPFADDNGELLKIKYNQFDCDHGVIYARWDFNSCSVPDMHVDNNGYRYTPGDNIGRPPIGYQSNVRCVVRSPL